VAVVTPGLSAACEAVLEKLMEDMFIYQVPGGYRML
jgi:hypothetical protein